MFMFNFFPLKIENFKVSKFRPINYTQKRVNRHLSSPAHHKPTNQSNWLTRYNFRYPGPEVPFSGRFCCKLAPLERKQACRHRHQRPFITFGAHSTGPHPISQSVWNCCCCVVLGFAGSLPSCDCVSIWSWLYADLPHFQFSSIFLARVQHSLFKWTYLSHQNVWYVAR